MSHLVPSPLGFLGGEHRNFICHSFPSGVPRNAQRWANTRVRRGCDGLALSRGWPGPGATSLSDVAGRDGTLLWTALFHTWAHGAVPGTRRTAHVSVPISRLPVRTWGGQDPVFSLSDAMQASTHFH